MKFTKENTLAAWNNGGKALFQSRIEQFSSNDPFERALAHAKLSGWFRQNCGPVFIAPRFTNYSRDIFYDIDSLIVGTISKIKGYDNDVNADCPRLNPDEFLLAVETLIDHVGTGVDPKWSDFTDLLIINSINI